jgi:hypothetical protein
MADLPKAVHIMEVGPRDGLQIERPRIREERRGFRG